MTTRPPKEIDNAKVLYWGWSDEGFFKLGENQVHGLAIAKYDNSKVIYRLSCNSNWKTLNDFDFISVEEAMNASSGNYDISKVDWQKF